MKGLCPPKVTLYVFSLFDDISFSIFIPFNSLVGFNHNHNFVFFLIYFLIILLKLSGIKVYFSRNVKILEEGRGDNIFQFFTTGITYKKIIYRHKQPQHLNHFLHLLLLLQLIYFHLKIKLQIHRTDLLM